MASGNALPSSGSNPNLTVGGFSYGNSIGIGSGITNNTPSSGYFGASGNYNMSTSSVSGALNTATSTYLSFSVTPTNGNSSVSISNISFASRSSQNDVDNGPTAITIRSSLDGFSSDLIRPISVPSFNTWTFYAPTILTTSLASGENTPIEFRIYGYNGSGNNPQVNWRIDDFAITITPVPEPGTIFGLGVAALGACAYLRRKFARTQVAVAV